MGQVVTRYNKEVLSVTKFVVPIEVFFALDVVRITGSLTLKYLDLGYLVYGHQSADNNNDGSICLVVKYSCNSCKPKNQRWEASAP